MKKMFLKLKFDSQFNLYSILQIMFNWSKTMLKKIFMCFFMELKNFQNFDM
jgi:hypothetical protein